MNDVVKKFAGIMKCVNHNHEFRVDIMLSFMKSEDRFAF